MRSATYRSQSDEHIDRISHAAEIDRRVRRQLYQERISGIATRHPGYEIPVDSKLSSTPAKRRPRTSEPNLTHPHPPNRTSRARHNSHLSQPPSHATTTPQPSQPVTNDRLTNPPQCGSKNPTTAVLAAPAPAPAPAPESAAPPPAAAALPPAAHSRAQEYSPHPPAGHSIGSLVRGRCRWGSRM